MNVWIVVSFDAPHEDYFRTKIVRARTADEALSISGESYAIALSERYVRISQSGVYHNSPVVQKDYSQALE